jgi:outer membrane murein-binding lipoprotein Lpp
LDFISEQFPFPQTVSEALEFLPNPKNDLFMQQFNHSLNILVDKVDELSFQDFNRLPNYGLSRLFTHPNLRIQSENNLFEFISQSIKTDPNRKHLLKIISYPAVSSQLLIDFCSDFPFEELNSDIFEALKLRLFCDIAYPNCSVPFSRWKKPPRFISRKEIAGIFKLVSTCFGQITNPVEQLKQLAEQSYKNSQLVEQSSDEKSQLNENVTKLSQTVDMLRKENQKLKEERSKQHQSIDSYEKEHQSQNQSINELFQENKQLKEEKNKQIPVIDAFKREIST